MDLDTDDINYNIELKIVEENDITQNKVNGSCPVNNEEVKPVEETATPENNEILETAVDVESEAKTTDSENDIPSKSTFQKVDIIKYRRNSSVNEDDIRLRRGNLEDFHALSNKRSKSLNNALDGSYTTFDINLNEEKAIKDPNGNEEPQKVLCKLYEDISRKQSVGTISNTENEFMEIDKATRELEREISKLNSALHEEDDVAQTGARLSVSDIKKRFDQPPSSPNPIPKPRRSNYGELGSPVNGNAN
jgi:hypothetical protein